MFLSHFSGTSLNVLLDMPSDEIHEWYVEAVKMHNKMNSTDG